MKSPEQIRSALRTRWQSQWGSWLGDGGEWPLRLALGAPSESIARAHWDNFRDWIAGWRNFQHGHVSFALRRWPSLGVQEVPTHVTFSNPASIAAVLGSSESSLWETAVSRFQERRGAWPECENALRNIANWMASASPDDFRRFVSVVDWLTSNPDSGLWLRQLPVPGLDTKWVEANTAPFHQVLPSRLGRESGQPFVSLAGLASDSPRRRILLLDPTLRSALADLRDITLSIDSLASLKLPVRRVIVVENLQTALAFDDLPGSMLFFGAGFAVAELRRIPWLTHVPILYWGDIDSAGFAILHTLRQAHPHATSVLMDEETLLRHRPLWSHDQSRPGVHLDSLREEEAMVYRKLASGAYGPAVRLEQERVDWQWAMERVMSALKSAAR